MWKPKAGEAGLAWITQMKGLAMIYIILFHWFGHHLTGTLKSAANAGAQGNHIFFMMSAFGLYLSLFGKRAQARQGVDWKNWFRRRAKKILVPYYASVVIVFASIFFCGFFTDSLSETFAKMHLNMQTALSTVFLYRNFIGSHTTAINTPWWFAITILQFYLFFPVLCAAAGKLGSKGLAFGSLAVNFLYICYYALYLKSDNNAFKCFPLQFIFSFSLGIVLCRIYLADEERFFRIFTGLKPFLTGFALEAAGFALTFQGLAGKALNDLLFGPAVFLITFNLVSVLARSRAAGRFALSVGEYSLPLFLLHAPYMFLLFPPRVPPGFAAGFYYFSLYAVFLAVLAWASSKLVFERLDQTRRVQAVGV